MKLGAASAASLTTTGHARKPSLRNPPVRRLVVPQFCSQCGSLMQSVATGASPSYPIVCGRCGGTHYSNPVPLVSCVIFSNDKVLLIRRAKAPFLGRWAPPGGYINHKESVDDAPIREVYEETGIRLNPNHLIPYSVAS